MKYFLGTTEGHVTPLTPLSPASGCTYFLVLKLVISYCWYHVVPISCMCTHASQLLSAKNQVPFQLCKCMKMLISLAFEICHYTIALILHYCILQHQGFFIVLENRQNQGMLLNVLELKFLLWCISFKLLVIAIPYSMHKRWHVTLCQGRLSTRFPFQFRTLLSLKVQFNFISRLWVHCIQNYGHFFQHIQCAESSKYDMQAKWALNKEK